MGDPSLAILVLIAFTLGLYLLVRGAIELGAMIGSNHTATDWGWEIGLFTLGTLVVYGPVLAMAAHPRTRSSSADFAFGGMKFLMFVAGIVAMAGGMLNVFGIRSFEQEAAVATVATLLILSSVVLQLTRR